MRRKGDSPHPLRGILLCLHDIFARAPDQAALWASQRPLNVVKDWTLAI